MRGGAAKIFLELVCSLLCRAEDARIAQWPRQPAQYGYCPHRRKLQPTMSNTCKENHVYSKTFLGHVMRRGKLEHLVTTGKVEGKRSRGRQREKIMDGLATWLGTGKVLDTLAAVKDRDLWRDMIANAYKQGT
ncbi:ecdysteroid udp-glucosyltransferase [Plakobranchus ocellatus]|uniref:Ecdysteroid udp-glucosyltransferase n=1 Tax=Plakobranchus ocellatus TaxID=259542 RepID=A0AAV4BU37_9GAST|nr:ecdysteroid udp-glucosyltransferase [Plakobranchus ocellatus]